MTAALQRLDDRCSIERQVSLEDRARDFVLVDCAVWISGVVSAAQRNDRIALVIACRSTRETLRLLGAHTALDISQQIETSCLTLSRPQMLHASSKLLREATDLANQLCERLYDPEWCEEAEQGFSQDESPTGSCRVSGR